MKRNPFFKALIILVIFGLGMPGGWVTRARAAGPVCYVDDITTGFDNGTSWGDAYRYLQFALGDSDCTEVHVAAGTYYPEMPPDLSGTFLLRSGQKVIGGYPDGGGGTSDPVHNLTTLDGNLGNYGYVSHVVTASGVDSSAVLDGFTIVNGTAMDSLSPGDRGGGIYIVGGSPTLRNLVISGNSASAGGAGIYLSDGSPTLTDVTISANGGPSSGSLQGGGLWSTAGSSPDLTRVLFSSNTADLGGGMSSTSGNPRLTNVTFQGNQASSDRGGGLFINSGYARLYNCIFDSNDATNGGGIYLNGGRLDMQDTRLENNFASSEGGGFYTTFGSDANILRSRFYRNWAITQGGGLYAAGRIVMVDGTFSENKGDSGGGGLFLEGSSSADFTNLTVDLNQSNNGGWGGGILLVNSNARFANLLMTKNTAWQAGGMMLQNSSVSIVNASIAHNAASHAGVAIFSDTALVMANSIVWDHTDTFSSISVPSGVISSSLLEDGCPAGASCLGLVSGDPQFADLAADDFRLLPTSPAVDAGDVQALPPDTADLDGDTDDMEPLSRDLNNRPRVVMGRVDMGALEAQIWNVNWTEAIRLDLAPVLPNVDSVSIGRYLDEAGQSRWYKFSVQPGSQVVVALTGLPANYDLALFKDIAQAYNELASASDLLQLSAEFAPDTFSPDTFSPDTFSPDTFSPDTFSPDTFSPDTFSPDTFSPDTFSPDTFSPDTFSPDTFSPDTFSPDTFSPDTFSPDTFSPDTFSPDTFSPDTFSPDTFSSAQTRSLIAVSAHDGTLGEGILVNTWTQSGDFYIRVRGRNGVFDFDNPFQLQVTRLSGACGQVSPLLPATNTPIIEGNYQTLILTNLDKTEGTSTEKTLLQTNLAALANSTSGRVVEVGVDARVNAAALQAQAYPACVYGMNLQAEAVKKIMDGYRVLNPNLKYLVLVGNDKALPFFRYPDNSLLASEIQYDVPVRDNTTSQASLKSGYILSQDGYGAMVDLSLKAGSLPIPDLPVGRLVETAGDINNQLQAYLGTSAGVISVANALVTGYDFLSDAADAVQAELIPSLGATNINTLIMDSNLSPEDPSAWTADDLRQQLLGSSHDLVFLAGHFSANSALAADYKTHLMASEISTSSTDFSNSLVYSAGCHSGYNIVNADGVPNVTGEPDWAQAFASKGATFIGGTGYQYGDTDFIEYSERLYLEFTKQLRYGSAAVAVGDALVRAKQAYLANTPVMRGIHEKTVLEATLFGLPMQSFDLPNRFDAPVEESVVTSTSAFEKNPGLRLGLEYADLIDYTPTFTENPRVLDLVSNSGGSTTVDAFYLGGPDGTVVNPAEPVLPLEMINVTSPKTGYVLRGVGWRGGEYTNLLDILPLTGAATNDLRAPHPAFFSDYFYPVRPWNVNYFDALDGPGGPTWLALMAAQYRSATPGLMTGILRRFDNLDFRLYYSNNITTYSTNTPALSAPPDISHISSVINPDGTVTFEVMVTGDPAAGIQEAWIVHTFDNGVPNGSWLSLDLVRNTADTRLWKGTLDLNGAPTEDLRFIVQAVNGVGLVTMLTNQGSFYRAGVDPAAPPQGQLPVTLRLEAPASSGKYGSQQGFTAIATQGTAPIAGLPIKFHLGGQGRLAITGEDGRASANFFLLAQPDEYTLQAAYDGDANYAPATDSRAFTIVPGSSVLVLTPEMQMALPGVNTEFIATLTSAGLPLAGKSVALTVDAGGVRQFTSLAVTDYAGQARWQVPGQSSGIYEVKAWFGLPVTTDLDLSNPYYTGFFDTASLVTKFDFGGLFAPVANPPTVNRVNAGSAVPVKFSLGGNFGLDIFATGYPTQVKATCQTKNIRPIVTTVSAGGSGLTYDPTTGVYTYTWKTDKKWAGTCGSLVMKFIDGTQKSALFQFTK